MHAHHFQDSVDHFYRDGSGFVGIELIKGSFKSSDLFFLQSPGVVIRDRKIRGSRGFSRGPLAIHVCEMDYYWRVWITTKSRVWNVSFLFQTGTPLEIMNKKIGELIWKSDELTKHWPMTRESGESQAEKSSLTGMREFFSFALTLSLITSAPVWGCYFLAAYLLQ